MPRNKKSNSKTRPFTPQDQQRQSLNFEGHDTKGTIVWSPLDENETQRLAADIEKFLVDRVLAQIRETH